MQKIKHYYENGAGKDILIILIVILVGISSFFMGRLSKESSQKGIKIEYTGQEASAIGSITQNKANMPKIELNRSISERASNNASGEYFASKNGKKYYPINCSAGKNIKQENRIYFNTEIDAQKAGYTLSSSC